MSILVQGSYFTSEDSNKLMVQARASKVSVQDVEQGLQKNELEVAGAVETDLDKPEIEKEVDMANLNILNEITESQCDGCSTEVVEDQTKNQKGMKTRSGRKTPLKKEIKRPVSKKVPLNENSSKKEIENIYLSKKVKRLPSTLETIFEEPIVQRGQLKLVAAKKLKRTINFNDDLITSNRLKLKKRKMKAKQFAVGGKFFNRKKIPMEQLMDALSSLDETSTN